VPQQAGTASSLKAPRQLLGAVQHADVREYPNPDAVASDYPSSNWSSSARRVSAGTPARSNRREQSHPSPLRRHNADQRIWRARAQVRCRSPNDLVIRQIRKVQL